MPFVPYVYASRPMEIPLCVTIVSLSASALERAVPFVSNPSVCSFASDMAMPWAPRSIAWLLALVTVVKPAYFNASASSGGALKRG